MEQNDKGLSLDEMEEVLKKTYVDLNKDAPKDDTSDDNK